MKKTLIFLIITAIMLLAGCAQADVKQQPETEAVAEETAASQTTINETIINEMTESTSVAASQPAAGPTEENEDAVKEVNVGDLENVFGFADESGKKLITVPGENNNTPADPQEFNVAVGNNGEIVGIKFVKRQEANSQDTLRQTTYNFDNMAGAIYEAVDGEFIPNRTYMLSRASVLNEDVLIKLISTRNTEAEGGSFKKADAETIGKIEAVKNRKVVESSLISETEDGAKICLFVFERKGDDMLASIAYIKDDQVVLKDYPAKYDEQSTWRVDAGGQPGLFEVLFLANSNEGLLLALTWAGPEGENEFVLKDVNGTFQDTGLKSGRYWAP